MKACDWIPGPFFHLVTAVHEAATLAEMPPIPEGHFRAVDELWVDNDPPFIPEPVVGGYIKALDLAIEIPGPTDKVTFMPVPVPEPDSAKKAE